MTVLVVDVGTSGLRAAVVRADRVRRPRRLPAVPARHAVPRPRRGRRRPAGRARARGGAARSSPRGGPVEAVGITNQRATSIVWDRATRRAGRAGPRLAGPAHHRRVPHAGRPGPALRAEPVGHEARLAPRHLRQRARPATSASARSTHGWRGSLSDGALHVTDRSNAAVTGLLRPDGTDWDDHVLDVLRRPASHAPPARRLERRRRGGHGARRRAADRRARRRPAGVAHRPGRRRAGPGQGHLRHRRHARPVHRRRRARRRAARGKAGTFPIVAWSIGGEITWGVEAIMLTAGANVDWLRRGPRHPRPRRPRATTSPSGAPTPAASCTCPRSSASARRRGTTAPAARCSASPAAAADPRSCGRCSEGVAHRGADLLEAAEADTGITHRVAARRRRHERQPDLRPGPGRRHAAHGRGVARRRGHHASAPASWPAWRSARGRASRRRPRRWSPRAVVEPGAGPRPRTLARRSDQGIRLDSRSIGPRLLESDLLRGAARRLSPAAPEGDDLRGREPIAAPGRRGRPGAPRRDGRRPSGRSIGGPSCAGSAASP